jgi:Leucine-rich repeat (LRR) protein
MNIINTRKGSPARRTELLRVICTLLITFLLLSSAGFFAPISAHAAAYKESGGFTYYLKGGKAYIINYTGREKSISLPQKIGGKTVVYVELCGWDGNAVDFTKCTGLQTLNTEQLYVGKLDLRSNRALKSLTLDESGGLNSLDLSQNSKLTSCLISSGQLSDINLSGVKKLKKLYLFHCPITKLDLTACTALTDLALQNTKLTTLSLVKNKSLKRVTLCDNKLKTVDTGKIKKLKGLKYS